MKVELKTRTIIILAAVMTGLVFLVTVLTSEMSYMTNDDGTIQSTFSGFFTGEPYPVQQYVNIVMGLLMTGLYRLIPGVQWWYVWSITAVAVGIFLVHVFVLKLGSKNRVFLPIVFGILIFLDIGFYMYPIANMAFTIVPAILGTGLVAGWFYLAHTDAKKYEKWLFLITIVGYVLLFCTRRQSGLVLLCFILLAYLYYVVSRSEKWFKKAIRFLITAGIFLLITVSLTAINRTVQNHYNSEEFRRFNSARSQFEDYPHASYEEDPELYAEVGWDEDIYRLVINWCFLPSEVTAENLSYISANSEYTTTDQREKIKDLYHNALDRSILKLYVASAILAGFVMIASRKKKNWIFVILNNLGCIALLAYQIYSGRAIYRSIMVVVLPAVVLNIMLSFDHKMEKKAVRILFAVVALVLGIEGLSPMLETTFDQTHRESVAKTKNQYRLVRNYRADHPENFYVVQKNAETNVAPEYFLFPSGVSNGYGWGGAVMYSPAYTECLKANGISELNADTLSEDNVYFISTTNAMDEDYYDNGSNLFATLLRYLEKECDAVGFVQVDAITDGAYVYHFVYEANEEDYNTYYDIVDGYTVEVGAELIVELPEKAE